MTLYEYFQVTHIFCLFKSKLNTKTLEEPTNLEINEIINLILFTQGQKNHHNYKDYFWID